MTPRDENIRRLEDEIHDVLIIGGGINGAVSAAALAGRGVRCALIDRGDFAGFTSQSSSNLAWGGIKYLENLELGLVRKLCRSRNKLMAAYPAAVQEIRFLAAVPRGFRHSRLKLFIGAVLYWMLGSFFTRPPRLLSRGRLAEAEPAIAADATTGGFEYSDAWLHDNDARFVWSFIRAALRAGCAATNYVESLGGEREGDLWHLRLRDLESGRELTARARVLVNAAGPFVDDHNARVGQTAQHRHVLSKGIHLIVDRVTKRQRVLTFFADDGRPFFVIPMGPRTCIGTTDTRVGDPSVGVEESDRRFVLDNVNRMLRLERPLAPSDIIAERCGVRPLVVEGGEVGDAEWLNLSRKHAVDVDPARAHVSIYGGKLTDCLNVGDEVCDEVRRLGVPVPRPRARWYGEPPEAERQAFFARAAAMQLDALTAPGAAEPLSQRLWRRYGSEAGQLLDAIAADPRQAERVIEDAETVRCEIAHAARAEMVVRLEDYLRRRSKIAQVISHDTLARSEGLREAARLLFGEQQAEARLREYFERAAGAQPGGAGTLARRATASATR